MAPETSFLEFYVLVVLYIQLDTHLLVQNNHLEFKIGQEFLSYLSEKLRVISLSVVISISLTRIYYTCNYQDISLKLSN